MDNASILIKRRPYVRSMKLQVIPSGTIICHANQSAKISDISTFVSFNGTWIQKQLDKLNTMAKKYPNIYWHPNVSVPFLGQFKPVKTFFGSSKKVIVHKDMIEIHFPYSKVSQTEWSELFNQHYKKLGIHLLQLRLKDWSDKMSLFPKKVTFRKYKSQWGSCSQDGNICLNWKLIVAHPCVIDYVIIHELAHLRHHNHSKLFWNLVDKYSDRTKECRKWLKNNQFAFDFLEDAPELHTSPFYKSSDKNQ